MKNALKVGLAVGILTSIWQLIMVGTGWLVRPQTFPLFYVVILIQIAVMIWGLKLTAAEHGYGRQVAFGTGASVVAAIFIFLYSLLLMLVLFPGLIDQMKAMRAQTLSDAGVTEQQIAAALALQTPAIQAFQGFLGTVVTGVLATLVIAIFQRKKA